MRSASQQVSQVSATASGPNREVFGYATAGSLGDPTYGYPSWNFNLLSTVAFFAIHVNYDGVLVADSDWNVWDSSTLAGLVTTAHAHGVKVVVSIKQLYNDTVDFCDMLYNDQTTILQLVNQVKLKNVDGVNIDYEGNLAQCNPTNPGFVPMTTQALMTQFAKDMRAGLDAVHPGYYLSIATYSGSASGNDGFFNIPNLNQYVDSFFVMAYDMDASNQGIGVLGSCPRFCLAPVSPLSGYYWNDTASMSQYVSVVGANKVILGLPYYGRVGCVGSTGPHATAGSVSAATYLDAAAAISSPDVRPGSYTVNRGDAYDPNGADRWDTWYDNALGCWREMYWSDATELGTRYDLVNADKLRGVGFWTLNYGGGASELWSQISFYFTSCKSVSVSASPSDVAGVGATVTVTAIAGGCRNPLYHFSVMAPGATSYQVVQDYSASNTLKWSTGGLTPGTWRFSVWAEDANSLGSFGNSAGRWDAYNNDVFFMLTSCSGVGVSAAPASPAPVGSSITLRAAAAGCPNPSPLYHFAAMAPGATAYQVLQDYSTSPTFTWSTTGLAPGTWRFSVWVKDAASAGGFGYGGGRWDAFNNSFLYTVTSCSGVNVSVAPSSPHGVGASVTLTAAAGCPNSNPLYHFGVMAPGATSYQVLQDYSTTATYTWNSSGLVPGTYRFSVWVKDAASAGGFGNSAGSWDAFNNNTTYTLTSCGSLAVSVSPPSPGKVGGTVTLKASAAGCPNPNPLYHFGVLAPGATAYQVLQDYSTSATYTWSTTGLAAGTYRFSVWVKDASSGGTLGNSAGRWDAYDNGTTYTLS